MPDDQAGLYKIMGELSADMKHVLRSLELNRNDTAKLRDEVKSEHTKLDARLSKVETFNTRVLAYATVGVTIGLPVMFSTIKWGVPALLNLL